MLLDPSSPEGIEARRFVERVRASRPYATTAVLASLIAVFVAESAFGGNEDVVTLAHMGANVVARTRGGELERVLAASTLHHGLMHIAMNGYVLWSLGRVVEALFGSARFLVLYVCAAILGGLATTLLGGGTVSVGASGAVWGVLTGMGVLAFRPAGLVPRAAIAGWRRTAIINLVMNVMISFMPGIDLWAHFGGGFAGALLVGTGALTAGLSLERPVSKSPLRGLFATLAAILVLAMVASVGVAWWRGRPWELAGEGRYERVAVTDLGISVELPSTIARSSVLVPTPIGTARSFGEEDIDPWVVLLLARARTQPIADVASREASLAQAQAELDAYAPGDGATSFGPATRMRAGENAVVLRQFGYPYGGSYVRMIVATASHEVLVEVLSRPGYESSQVIAPRVASSISGL